MAITPRAMDRTVIKMVCFQPMSATPHDPDTDTDQRDEAGDAQQQNPGPCDASSIGDAAQSGDLLAQGPRRDSIIQSAEPGGS